MLSSLAQVSDHELLARVKQLASREREVTTALIAHLAELDERRLYLAEGYSSLFGLRPSAPHHKPCLRTSCDTTGHRGRLRAGP